MNYWEQEYQNPQFLTLGTEPLSDVRHFMKWLRRKQKVEVLDFTVLDCGCGNGKNLKYVVSEFANKGIGFDIAPIAIQTAQKLSGNLPITYHVGSFDFVKTLKNNSVDLVLDITALHVLDDDARIDYIQELSRVIKQGGYMMLRTLCSEGDKNAKQLIKEFPGNDPNTYILPGTHIQERVFTWEEIIYDFGFYFNILLKEKTIGYQKWNGQSYKRNYWVVYLQRK